MSPNLDKQEMSVNTYEISLTKTGKQKFGVHLLVGAGDVDLKKQKDYTLTLDENQFKTAYKGVKSLEEAGLIEVRLPKAEMAPAVKIAAKDAEALASMEGTMIKLGVIPTKEEVTEKIAEEAKASSVPAEEKKVIMAEATPASTASVDGPPDGPAEVTHDNSKQSRRGKK